MANILNCTPHAIMFINSETGNEYSVAPSGYVLRAAPVETIVYEDGVNTFVKTIFVPSDEGMAELEEIEEKYPDHVIVGSIVSAQAFPGRVAGMIPTVETARSAPADKRYYDNKFNIF